MMVEESNNNEDELERAICQKSEVEFKIAIREWDEQPISKEQLAKIEENIKREYHPFTAFRTSVDIRVEYYILPLIKKLIEIETESRNASGIIFTEKRIADLQYYFRNLARKSWESIAYKAYGDAVNHVIHNTGYLPEYKDVELKDSRDNMIKLEPDGLYSMIDELLYKASAESKIRKIQSQKENSQPSNLSQIHINGNVSGSTIIIGNDNETLNSQEKGDVQ